MTRLFPRRVFARAAACIVALAVTVPVLAGSASGAVPPAPYRGPAVSGPENVVFFYHSIAEGAASGELARIGHPRDLVFGAPDNPSNPGAADEPPFAHSIGASAYTYLQFTWFPAVRPTWMGTTPEQRAPWALCRNGDIPLTGLHGPTASRFTYADANERAYVDAVLGWTAQIKALGYDGIFVDGGGKALRRDNWNVQSSCTTDPVTPGRPSADAWLALLMQVKAQGLKVAVNMGAPTADPLTRPDPNNPTRIKTDPRGFAWILHEGQGHPKENYPGSESPGILPLLPSFESLATRSVNDSLYARGQVVQMAKARMPVEKSNRRWQEEYVWALAKLSGGPVVMNTGYGFCDVPAATKDCSRTGLAPGFVDLRLGSPIDAAPYKAVCSGAGCMWVRRFRNGLVAVSAYGSPPRTAIVPLGTAGCRRVLATNGGRQARGRCINQLNVNTSHAHHWGHVYLYAK